DAVGVERDVQIQFVPAQGVVALGVRVSRIEPAEIAGVAVVVDDDVAIQLLQVHGLSEDAARLFDAGGEAVEFGAGIVEGQRGAGGGRNLVEVHQRHGAVVAGAHGNAFRVQYGAEVVRM